MASIWKDDRSPFFTACFTGYVGASARQFKRTTGTANRRLAQRIADKLDDVGRGACSPEGVKEFLSGSDFKTKDREGNEQEDLRAKRKARQALDYALRQTTGRSLESKTVKGFVESWLERTRGEVSAGTRAKYEATGKLFLASLGGKAEQDIAEVRKEDIARFRDVQGKRVARSTANVYLKIVRIIFAAAEADGLIVRNEAKHIKKLKLANEAGSRRAFTLPELNKILAQCDDEWRSMVLFGFYTGARLGDVARLTWQNLDLANEELSYISGKTGRQVRTPLSAALSRHIHSLSAGDDPKQPLHSRAYEILSKHGKAQRLSSQFADILADATLIEPRSHQVEDSERKGRDTRRNVSEISFHSLRHTAVSLLKTAGVSDAVAQDLVGHESAEISRQYTHIETPAKRAAVDKLPVIGQ
ncbi:MAG: tyrosine-type recombinase/integrase [Verrucomicrobiota bacterium]